MQNDEPAVLGAGAVRKGGQSELGETELIRRVRQADARAFEEIMRRNNRRLFRVAYGILKDDAEAEDAVQESYVRAYSGLGDFQGKAGLSTWLVKIAVNESLGRLRKRRPQVALSELAGDTASKGGLADGMAEDIAARLRNDPEAAAARGEIRRLLERAIEALPQAYRAVFVLRGLEEFSIDETASFLGIPRNTVKSRHHRAMSLLRRVLEKEMENALSETFPFAGARCDRTVAMVLQRVGLKPPD